MFKAMLHSLERHLHLCVLLSLFIIHVCFGWSYVTRTLGELLRMHSGCFCYRSNNVWLWKEQGLVSFATMKYQKCQKNALTTPPSHFSQHQNL
jgi:hypothetical protein